MMSPSGAWELGECGSTTMPRLTALTASSTDFYERNTLWPSEMKTNPCPRCNSTTRQRGEILPKGVLWDVRFKAEAAPALSLKKKVIALACLSCGYIELFL